MPSHRKRPQAQYQSVDKRGFETAQGEEIHPYTREDACTVLSCMYCTVLYVLYCPVCTVLSCMYCTVLYVLYCMYCTVLYVLYCPVCTVLYVLYCTVCTVLSCMYCTVLYVLYCPVCTVLSCMYCTVLYVLYCPVCTVLGKAADIFYKRLASIIAEKRKQTYSSTICWIRCQLNFSLIQSAIVCLRGSRCRYPPRVPESIELTISESKIKY